MDDVIVDEAPPPPKPKPKPKRRPRAGIVGPLFGWELLRLARRGQDARARFVLAAALLLVLTLFTFAWFPQTDPFDLFLGTSQELSLEQSAKFAEQFALTFVLAQLGVLMLLTPAYAAGGISEEKEKQTFVFLMVSDLTSREIIFGKFLGRLVFLLGVMLAGLPVLALTQLYGGVSIAFLLMAYFLTGTTVTMMAAVSAASACATENLRGALFRSYGLMALLVFLGGGLGPYVSPFAIVWFLFLIEPNSTTAFLIIGLGYGLIEMVIALVAVLLAIRWVRKQRAQPIRRSDPRSRRRDDDWPRRRDDDWPRRRDDRWDDDRWDEPRKTSRKPVPTEPIILDDDPPAGDGATKVWPPAPAANGTPDDVAYQILAEDDRRPRPTVAARVPKARLAPPEPRKRDRPRRRPPPPPLPDYIANRPRVDGADPFLWKEKYVAGTKRTGDDDSIRGVLIAVGVAIGVTVGFFLLIAVMAVAFSGASDAGLTAAGRMLLFSGAGGLFTYLLVIGSSAAGSVVRERQRMTLESLLTIPVSRAAILWPKWRVSVAKGWWWGVPSALLLPLAFLASDTPLAWLPGIALVAAAVPFAVSYGLWLSVRCPTVTRATLWFLPAAGGLTLTPIVAYAAFDQKGEWLAVVVLAAVAVAVGALAWVFWALAAVAFEREGR